MIYLHGMKLRSRIAVVATMLLSSIAGTTTADAATAFVKVSGLSPGRLLSIRSGPGSSFKRIDFLPYNARDIRNDGCEQLATGYWCRVRYHATRGWALGPYVRGWALGRYLAKEKARIV